MQQTTSTPTPSASPATADRADRPGGGARDQSMRTAALVAGVGLLLLAASSAWAIFGVVEPLVTEGDAVRTAQDIVAAASTFRLGVAALGVTAALDVVVAWALWAFFAPVHRAWSAAAAWLRTVYAGIFAAAITQLGGVLAVLPNTAAAITSGQAAEALRRIESYYLVWDIGLLIFGLHLVAIGCLAHRARYVPRLVGPLVVLAGAGYVLDSLVALLAPGALPEVAPITFVGEVLLLVWLLIKGRTVTGTELPTS